MEDTPDFPSHSALPSNAPPPSNAPLPPGAGGAPDAALRLFIALLLPDEITGQFAALAGQLRKGMQFTGCRARWVPRENMHLTLAFLGDQPAGRVAALEAILDALAGRFEPLWMEAKGIGAFPHWQRPRVLWGGLRDRSGGALARLHEALHEALAPLGYRAEDKDFRPHVTLARFDNQRATAAIEKLAHDHERFHSERFAAGRLALMLSRLGPGGARYEPLATRRLSAAPARPSREPSEQAPFSQASTQAPAPARADSTVSTNPDDATVSPEQPVSPERSASAHDAIQGQPLNQ